MKKYRFSQANKMDAFRSKIFDFKLIGGKFSLGSKVRTDSWVNNMEAIYKQVLKNTCKRVFKKQRNTNHALYRRMNSVDSRLWFTLTNPRRTLGILITNDASYSGDMVYQVICYHSEVAENMFFSTMEDLFVHLKLNPVKGCKLSDSKYWGMETIRHQYTIGTLPTGKPLKVCTQLTDTNKIYYGHHTHTLNGFSVSDLPMET